MSDILIIDGHSHFYNDTVASKIIKSMTDLHNMQPTKSVGKGTIDDIQNVMKKCGISYSVMANFGPAKSIDRINKWALSLAKNYNNIIPLVSVHPEMPLEIVKEYFYNGAKGIKMHNGIQGFDAMDKGLFKIYEYCEQNNIPVTFHCGETSRLHLNEYTEMNRILPAVKSFPGITFVLTHLASGIHEQTLKIAEDYKNVIFDTSVALTGEHCIYRIHDNFWENDENAVKAFRKIGFERITFGSDYPLANPESDINRIKALPISQYEKELILGINTYNLYFK